MSRSNTPRWQDFPLGSFLNVSAWLFLMLTPEAQAETWKSGGGLDVNGMEWAGLTSSADGQRLAGVIVPPESYPQQYESYIVVSTNYGLDWNPTVSPEAYWSGLAASADGTKMVAVQDLVRGNGGLIYLSTNSGANWAPSSAGSNEWSCVAMSADGGRIAAASYNGALYWSDDAGLTWNQAAAPSNFWVTAAMSADGMHRVAASEYTLAEITNNVPGFVYCSSDGGKTWQQASAPSNDWTAVTCSADGTRMAAVANQAAGASVGGGDGLIYLSTNSGATWDATSAPASRWNVVTCSADGTRFVAGAGTSTYGDYLYVSTNAGAAWAVPVRISGHWTALACTADGGRVFAGGNDKIGIINASPFPESFPVPARLGVASDASNCAVSWLAPSIGYVLQERSDLSTANWVDVVSQPTLNLSNLNYEVITPMGIGSQFFRLRPR